jgi:hypothetical protein
VPSAASALKWIEVLHSVPRRQSSRVGLWNRQAPGGHALDATINETADVTGATQDPAQQGVKTQ